MQAPLLALASCVTFGGSLHLPELSSSEKRRHLSGCATFNDGFSSGVSPPRPSANCLLSYGEPQTPHLQKEDGRLRREWQPTPVFLLGESHGQRSLKVYSSWGRRVGIHRAANMHAQAKCSSAPRAPPRGGREGSAVGGGFRFSARRTPHRRPCSSCSKSLALGAFLTAPQANPGRGLRAG